jgi:hypothetical protein
MRSSFRRRRLPAGWLAAALLLPAAAARAQPAGEGPPVLVGPLVLQPAGATVPSASYRVEFAEGGRTARVELTLQVAGPPGDLVLGFAGRGVGWLGATVDGAPVEPERAPAPLAAPGGPFGTERLVRAGPGAGGVRTVVVRALCEARTEEREPQLTFPQATFARNRGIAGLTARVLRFDPAAAAGADLAMSVTTVAPQWPEAPVAGTRAAAPGGWALEGAVVADPGAPLEAASVEGSYERASNWAFQIGLGTALDWPHVEMTETAGEDGPVVERWYVTPGFHDYVPRLWLRGALQHAFDEWLLTFGVEGDPGGVLELPCLFTWFPQEGGPDRGDTFADYHFFGGLALQVFNDAAPHEHAFDPRPFVRVGAGVRLLLFTIEIAYEIAPPVGPWNGAYGMLEHKAFVSLPLAI